MICMGRISILHVARRTFATSNVNFVRFRGSATNPPSGLIKVGKLCGSKKEGLFEPGQLFLHRAFAYRGVIICSFNVKVKEVVKPFRGSATNPPSGLVKVGKLCGSKKEGLFEPGQLFLHRAFAYRGVIICSFNVKVKEVVKPNEAISHTEIIPYYQVLIDRTDWDYMNFQSDMTSYFTESAVGRVEKVLTIINGMDCVPHHEVIPYSTTDKDAIKHDLFTRIFEPNEEGNEVLTIINGMDCVPHHEVIPYSSTDKDAIKHDLFTRIFEPNEEGSEGPNFNIKKNLFPNFAVSNKQSWLTPQSVHKATNENVQLTVIPYYLGQTLTAGQQKYFWRYTVRLESLDKKPAVLRDRILKVFSLNNLQQVNGPGVVGGNPRLTAENSVYQFSSIVDLSQPKGGHMWGRFTMERDDGTTFEIQMPTIPLECHPESTSEQNEFENNHN
uniref:ApaG domain-containing protein n=1 Tax=Panagrolaimus sp. ES5 TaxID=591445 RepID=A0AC34F9C0_9BILA